MDLRLYLDKQENAEVRARVYAARGAYDPGIRVGELYLSAEEAEQVRQSGVRKVVVKEGKDDR